MRERERERETHTHTHIQNKLDAQSDPPDSFASIHLKFVQQLNLHLFLPRPRIIWVFFVFMCVRVLFFTSAGKFVCDDDDITQKVQLTASIIFILLLSVRLVILILSHCVCVLAITLPLFSRKLVWYCFVHFAFKLTEIYFVVSPFARYRYLFHFLSLSFLQTFYSFFACLPLCRRPITYANPALLSSNPFLLFRLSSSS